MNQKVKWLSQFLNNIKKGDILNYNYNLTASNF